MYPQPFGHKQSSLTMYAFERAFASVGGDEAHGSDSASDTSAEDDTQEGASQLLADLLVELKMRGTLSAKDVCLIAYYASGAGMVGPAATFAFRPGAPTGHYSRHLNAVLKLDDYIQDAYTLDVPGHDKYARDRQIFHIPCLPPHETLANEISKSQTAAFDLRAKCAEKEWSDSYFQHEVVRAALPGESVWPVALYLDGVPFIKRDTLTGWWAYNLVTEKRHLLLTLRKSQLCRCGCLSWCSLSAVWDWLAWSFRALTTGEWPATRHDGQPFLANEAWRAGKATTPLIKAALVNLKGDWADIVHTWGFCQWNHVTNPCFACWSDRDHLPDIGDTSAVSGPCRAKTPGDYDEACRKCEIVAVVPDLMVKAQLVGTLYSDKRQKGGRGRTLRAYMVS